MGKKFFLKSKIIWKDILMLISIALLTCHDLIMTNIEYIKATFNGKILYIIMSLLTISSIYLRYKSVHDPLTIKKSKMGKRSK